MKNNISCLIGILLAFSLAGCKNTGTDNSQSDAAQTSTQTAIQTETTESETVTTPPPPLTTVHVEKNILEKVITDADGNTLIKASMELPTLITDVPYEAADTINNYFKTLSDNWFNQLATETKTEVLDAMPLDSADFSVWTTDLSFEVTYNTNGVLSILQLEYINSGGAHPSSSRRSHTFELDTGNVLEITDILNGSAEEITALVTDGFVAQIKENPENFYNDAKKIITGGETYDGFYLNDKAVVFYYQTYDIAPYAAGYPQFSIPYTETDKFKIKL